MYLLIIQSIQLVMFTSRAWI